MEGIEVLQHLVLGYILIRLMAAFGGFLEYGTTLVGVSGWLLVLGGLHALSVLFRKHRSLPCWEWLLPLPILAYAGLQAYVISPVPWKAELVFFVLLQASGLYVLLLTTMQRERTRYWILWIVQITGLVALLVAFMQHYQFPHWVYTLDRERVPGFLEGAAGFFMDPIHMGALLILLWPATVIVAVLPRFPGPIRMFEGFLVFAIYVGLLLSSHPAGLCLLGVVLVLLPFLTHRHWREQWRLLRWLLLGLVVTLPLFYFTTGVLRDRLTRFFNPVLDALAEGSVAVAWSQFLDQPILGQGIGAFATYWEAFRPDGLEGEALYPVSTWAGVLAEWGVLGLALILAPLGVLYARGLRTWWQAPYLEIDKDTRERMARLPLGHPTRKRMEKASGRAPLARVILGSLLTGIAAFLIYELWSYALMLPFFILLVAVLAALLGVYGRQEEGKRRTGRLPALAVGLVPMLLFSVAALFSVPRLESQHLAYTASERLDFLLSDPDQIYLEPDILDPVIHDFSAAVSLYPGHGDALTGLGRGWLANLHAAMDDPRELAQAARPWLEAALELNRDNWEALFSLARVELLLGEDPERAVTLLREATALAPQRVEPWYLLAGTLLQERATVEEAVDIMDRVPVPQDPPAWMEDITAELGLQEGEIPSRRTLERFRTVFPAARLAEWIDLEAAQRERILAAGLPAFAHTLEDRPSGGE